MIRAVRRDAPTQAEAWFSQFWTMLLRICILVFLGYFLWRVRSILADVLIATILAFALTGPVDQLCKIHVRGIGPRAKRLIACLIVFAAFAFVIVEGIGLMLSPFHSELLRFNHHLPEYKSIVASWMTSAKAWYFALPPDLRAFLQHQGSGGLSSSPTSWISSILAGTVYSLSKIIDILLIPVLAFYFVQDGHSLRNELLALLPSRRRREALRLLHELYAIMRTFVMAQIWLCVIAGVVVFVGLSLIHMPYALILGLLAGVTRAIPIVGPVIGGIPIVLLAAFQSPLLAVKVLIFFSVLHLIESKLIMPKFIGNRIHLHAALVIIVLLVGNEFFGLLGMFFAAPLAAFARVVINYYIIRPRFHASQTVAHATPPNLVIKAN